MALAHPLAEQCTATSKASGLRCLNRVIGGGVCRIHGGAAPQVRIAREARILVAEAAQEQPLSAVDAADALTSAMNDSYSLLGRLKVNIASGRLESRDLSALGDWVDRTARISKLVIDAGIQERQTRLSEGQGRMIAAVLQRIFGQLELNDRQRNELIPVVVPAELRGLNS